MHGASGERDEGGRERETPCASDRGRSSSGSFPRQDEDALDFLAEVGPKVAQVAGNEMRPLASIAARRMGTSLSGNNTPLGSSLGARRKNVCFWTARQPTPLNFVGEVDSCFF